MSGTSAAMDDSVRQLEDAFTNQISDLQVKSHGNIVKLLPDDLEGSRHQRFIVQLSSGKTLLIAHNSDLAPRVKSVQLGDYVEFYGEYEWNPEWGVIHWTHQDPTKRHIGGWIKHNGKVYQ
ncbi:DUF3465 domain-containing protein [Acaryochloris thomasi]